MKEKIYACLLAGGKGTRLWPLSTPECSKSFVKIGKRKPLIEDTITRLKGFVKKTNIIAVVDKTQKSLVKGIPKKNIVTEPFGRSTASAIGLAAIKLKPDDIMVAMPTDHIIKNAAAFRKTLKKAVNFIRKSKDALLCIGIKPSRPSTAYGYIRTGALKAAGIYAVARFMEKPSKKIAAKLVKKSCNLWNAGMFIFRAKDILGAMEKHSPLLYKELLRIKKDKGQKRAAYSRMKNVSIDYQVMEKAKNLYCIKANFSWNDVGNWNSVGALFKKDKNGNACFGKVALTNTRNTIVYNSEKEKLGIVGMRNAIVAQTRAGILVCEKKDAEKLKELAARRR